MDKEAVRYAAATRIIARWRGAHMHYYFHLFLRCLCRLQAHIRRRQRRAKTQKLHDQLLEDWLFRIRYYRASLIQAALRRYIVRCRHLKLMKQVREQQMAIAHAKRMTLRKVRLKMRKGVIYREIRSVNGVMVVLRIHRKDQRNYSKDFGVILLSLR